MDVLLFLLNIPLFKIKILLELSKYNTKNKKKVTAWQDQATLDRMKKLECFFWLVMGDY